ncbi:MAG: hypothetical protein ACI8W7_003910 [Gammaproteobacteria bacterium]|jgi:hypothetical protein
MPNDRLELPLTTTEDAALAYVDGVDRMLAAWPGVHERLSAAIELDADFALGHAAMARYLAMQGKVAAAQDAAMSARTVAKRATRRERQHVECIALLVHGKPGEALRAVHEHVEEFATDSLALSLALGAFGLHAFSGRADHDAVRLALCERVAAKHSADDWWFLSYFGWAHTEAGNLRVGQDLSRRGFELRRENAHGAHSMAHSFHECGQYADAVAHLDDWLPDYDVAGQLHCHLNWHRALLDVQMGDVDAALTRLRTAMAPTLSTSPPINIFTDGASLLWRIMLYEQGSADSHLSAPMKQHWQELAAYAHDTWPRPAVSFIDAHCAMADAAMGDQQRVTTRAEALRELDASGALAAGAVPATLAQALGAYMQGDYVTAADNVEAILTDLPRLGGSHAQREIHEETLIAACLKCDRRARAAELLNERLARRPSAIDQHWLSIAN